MTEPVTRSPAELVLAVSADALRIGADARVVNLIRVPHICKRSKMALHLNHCFATLRDKMFH